MATQFRARGATEDMQSYLQAKQAYEIQNTGSSGIQFGSPTPTPDYNAIQAGINSVASKIPALTENVKAFVAQNLQNTQTPATLPQQKTDTTNYNGLLSSGTAMASNTTDPFKDYMDKIIASAPSSTAGEDKYNADYANAGIDAKAQQVQDLTNQLNNINAEAGVATNTLESQAGGKDVTSTFLGRQQQEVTRQAAIKSLPIQAQLASAQGNLTLAQDKLNTLYKIQSDDATNLANYNKELRTAVFEYATTEQKAILDAQQRAEDKVVSLAAQNRADANTYSIEALNSGQGSLSAQITALDAKSPTFQSDLAKLVEQIKPKATTSTTPTTPEEKSVTSDLQSYRENLANNKIEWRDAYQYFLRLYQNTQVTLGTTTATLTEGLSPEQIIAAGGDPSIDKTLLDIILGKKNYL